MGKGNWEKEDRDKEVLKKIIKKCKKVRRHQVTREVVRGKIKREAEPKSRAMEKEAHEKEQDE